MNKKSVILIAGPCVIENEEVVFETAEKLKDIAYANGVNLYFKASFDKANRTSISSFRGLGIKKGLKILENVKRELGVKIATDIHEPWQAEVVAETVDMIQIPAFLCRQTDILTAAGRTGKIINVKKGQFISPMEVIYITEKIESTGNSKILLCERGTSFGYNRLVVDMRGIYEMKKTGYLVAIDATHSTQQPGGNGGTTGGNREYAEVLAKAAVAAGADALFFEVHPNPDEALSDGTNMVRLDEFDPMLKRILKVYKAVH